MEIEQRLPSSRRSQSQHATARPSSTTKVVRSMQPGSLSSRRFMTPTKSYKSPYSEPIYNLALYQGKTLPPPKNSPRLVPTKIFGHVPTGKMQSPVVVSNPDEKVETVEYRVREKHWKQYDKDCELNIFRKVDKHSPYRESLSKARAQTVLSTRRMLKDRDHQDAMIRKRECEEYEKEICNSIEADNRYPKSDIIHNVYHYLRINVTD
ncbi:hypothetical protein TVAG_013030 [Trichomonas vaginalis G3]|uniref:Uncharacterized protein n=1 Tax=Trichomonas vaginalis (strain ATCC PRA-98 / G3) TaxID=412133 RepID=A2DD59_TRIV3|nr:hypothetical protein TVAGG3_0987800 [Trichomonas vaginalis G3]EAY21538.1 hypothetical protein TVAG_013030 [Trichomonas vaginalis G3]KAI5489804.1 hypothetical protein TVAGG3_0987800 [Trichomonas vaginalis G3]|eukprot:XP_001582524.1 hypothetical protein [Trichomonas vaginalis G3]